MELVPCDIFSHSFSLMIRELQNKGYNPISYADVLHIGAHDGIEADIYDYYGAKNVNWFECNPYVFPNLLKRINEKSRKAKHLAYQAALWDKAGEELEFRFYRNQKDGASGFFLPEKMFDYIKDCPLLEETIKIKTNTLDNYINDGIIDISQTKFLNIDVQGAELKVFQGANTLLNNRTLEFIWCEVSWDNVYKEAPLMSDITDYLKGFDFEFVGLRKDWEIHGDALYWRKQ